MRRKARARARILRETATDFMTGLFIFLIIFLIAAIEQGAACPVHAATAGTVQIVKSDDRAKHTLLTQSKSNLRIVVVKPTAGNLPGAGAAGIPVPQMAGGTARKLLIGVMALLFGGMCALTLGLWRHLARAYAPARPARALHHSAGVTYL